MRKVKESRKQKINKRQFQILLTRSICLLQALQLKVLPLLSEKMFVHCGSRYSGKQFDKTGPIRRSKQLLKRSVYLATLDDNSRGLLQALLNLIPRLNSPIINTIQSCPNNESLVWTLTSPLSVKVELLFTQNRTTSLASLKNKPVQAHQNCSAAAINIC